MSLLQNITRRQTWGLFGVPYLKHRERGEALPDFFKDKIDDFLLKHANREAENFFRLWV